MVQAILNFFIRKEHQNPDVFTEEEVVFKHNFRRYYIRKINRAVEFWARDEKDERLNFYLGKVIGEKIVLSKAFYTHPYDVQKGGGRLARIYLHNDHREL